MGRLRPQMESNMQSLRFITPTRQDPMATLERAAQAVMLLRNRLRNAAWLQNIELGVETNDDYCIRVSVAALHPEQRIIPRELLGFRVHVGLVN
jgi:hypothetical protein